MTQAEQKLRAAAEALPVDRFEACRGSEGTGCTCGQVWAAENDRLAFVAHKEHPDDPVPGYTPEQARAHAEALEAILNALPDLLDSLQSTRAALERAEGEAAEVCRVKAHGWRNEANTLEPDTDEWRELVIKAEAGEELAAFLLKRGSR